MLRPIANDLSPFGRYAPKGVTASILELTRRCSTSWSGMRRAFLLRGIAVRTLAGRPLDVEAYGARMRLYPYNNTCEKRILFTPQYFDPAERRLLANYASDDARFIDIGANVGGYTLFMAALSGPRARILAIEPNPSVFERLTYNIRQNPFATVKALDCAVADREGEITLFLDPRNQGCTSVRISHAGGDTLKVHANSLKSILAHEGYDRIDALKVDVEGAEDVVLEPFFREAPPALWPRLILCARSNTGWSVDLARMLSGYGYRETLRSRSNVGWERV
jgi:FkbM family methyltransferase